MEAPEYVMGSHSSSSGASGGDFPNVATILTKKRTKRQRSTSTSSLDFSSATEEDEDMARCLILLAQGHNRYPLAGGGGSGGGNTEKFVSRKFTETTTTAGGKAGFYVYECKTCNRCFPSFQALGGHRASHKKPRFSIQPFRTDDPKQIAHGLSITDGIIAANYNKLRVHECSICGAEFSSGQALGGHMRRHRPIVPGPPELQEGIKKDRNDDLLSLDLNLPAPTDEPAVAFLPKMVFSSTSALVDCHY